MMNCKIEKTYGPNRKGRTVSNGYQVIVNNQFHGDYRLKRDATLAVRLLKCANAMDRWIAYNSSKGGIT